MSGFFHSAYWFCDSSMLLVLSVALFTAELLVVVQLPSHVWLFLTPWTAACQVSPPLNISWNLPKFMSFESVMPCKHLILYLTILLLPSVFPRIRVFSNESAVCIRWPKYWSFNFNISPSKECSGLISFKIDWFDLLAVQGTLNSFLQHHNWKASILWHSCLLYSSTLTSVHDYWKDNSLTIWTFVGQVMSLLFNT